MKNYSYEDVTKILKFCGGYHLTEAEVSSILNRPALTESAKNNVTKTLTEQETLDEDTKTLRRLLGTPLKENE